MRKGTPVPNCEGSVAVSHPVRQKRADMSNIWVLVADRARARLFQFTPSGRKLSETACFDNPEAQIHATARDRLPRTTMREKSIHRFARSLRDERRAGRSRQRYERLILIAPPRFRGALHRHTDKQLCGCISSASSNS